MKLNELIEQLIKVRDENPDKNFEVCHTYNWVIIWN